MADTHVTGHVPNTPDEAFDIYVNQLDKWWPRRGIFNYSYAPKDTLPDHFLFEAKEGGRLYEVFANGGEFDLGKVLTYEPGKTLAYSWKDPQWQNPITFTIRFKAADDGTTVIMENEGFAGTGSPELAPYYQIGNEQTLAAYLAHASAVFKMRTLEKRALEMEGA